jgi:hypothetical protein
VCALRCAFFRISVLTRRARVCAQGGVLDADRAPVAPVNDTVAVRSHAQHTHTRTHTRTHTHTHAKCSPLLLQHRFFHTRAHTSALVFSFFRSAAWPQRRGGDALAPSRRGRRCGVAHRRGTRGSANAPQPRPDAFTHAH